MKSVEVLIKWHGLPDYEATWEELSMVAMQFPDFHLEDKVSLWERGNVIHSVNAKGPLTYARKKTKTRALRSSKEAKVNTSQEALVQGQTSNCKQGEWD